MDRAPDIRLCLTIKLVTREGDHYFRSSSSLMLIALALGCGDQPRAPSLQNEPVYQNSREGFRLLVPEGWTMHARGELPSGKLDRERMLVSYELLQSDMPAAFQITAADLTIDTNLEKYLSGRAFGISDWQLKFPPEDLEIDGQPARRYTFGRPRLIGPEIREVVAFRRGERVYFFTAMFPGSDAKAREQIRRAIESLVWK
jgi:hypothetical protein